MIRIIFILLFLSICLPIQAKDMRFIQVTDTFYNTENEQSAESLKNVVSDINKQRGVEFVVFTGNNIAKPTIDNLEKKEYVEVLRKKVKAHRKIESPNYVFEKKHIVFIVADGSKDVIPSSMGYYKADVLSWLDEQLNLYKDKNVVILQHFPIVPPAEKESKYTFKADEYLKLLSRHNNVKAVFAGHFGVDNEQTVNGILHVATGNSPKYRIIDMTDYETQTPTFWSVIKEVK